MRRDVHTVSLQPHVDGEPFRVTLRTQDGDCGYIYWATSVNIICADKTS